MIGGIEAGGTKFVCGVGHGPEDLVRREIPTTTPGETLELAIHFLRQHEVKAIGIASFGPVDLRTNSETYGHITSTPKAGWRNTDIRGAIARALNVPVAFDTDVNGALLAEALWGAARGLTDAVYLTVGTGIGGGALAGGKLVHGLLHPEMGHIRIPHDGRFKGDCPFHGDCLEGLASGPAVEKQWGVPAQQLPPDHEAWDTEADYLANGISNVICALSPKIIILGGGVPQAPGLISQVNAKVQKLMNGYLECPPVVAPELGNNAGVLGAIALATSL